MTGKTDRISTVLNTNNSGQALMETVLVITFVLGFFFALVQLFLLATTRIVMFDAAQSAARAQIVKKDPQLSALYVLSSQQLFSQVFPSPVAVKYRGQERNIVSCEINYMQKISFPSFFSFFRLSMLPGKAYCRMSASPEPQFFNKSWPGAANERQ